MTEMVIEPFPSFIGEVIRMYTCGLCKYIIFLC